MSVKTVPSRQIAGATVPDTALIASAIEYARSHLSPMSFNHVIRSYLFGFIIASKNDTFATRDQEVHAVSAILHDMGWDATGQLVSEDKRFEVDGADAARNFLARNAADWDRYRVQLVWDAIAMHSTPSISLHHGLETAACVNGIIADFVGPSEGVTKEEYAAVVREYPRLNLADGIKEIYCGFCRTKPETTRDNAVGQIGQAHIEGFHASPDWYLCSPVGTANLLTLLGLCTCSRQPSVTWTRRHMPQCFTAAYGGALVNIRSKSNLAQSRIFAICKMYGILTNISNHTNALHIAIRKYPIKSKNKTINM